MGTLPRKMKSLCFKWRFYGQCGSTFSRPWCLLVIISAIIANFLKLLNLSGGKIKFLLAISLNSYELEQTLDEINKIKYKLNLFLWKSLKLSGIHLPRGISRSLLTTMVLNCCLLLTQLKQLVKAVQKLFELRSHLKNF